MARCRVAPYAENHVWSRARAAALVRDGHACARCGVRDGLHVHHRTPVAGDRSEGCRHHLDGLEVLCERCHLYAHRLLRSRGVTQIELPFRTAA